MVVVLLGSVLVQGLELLVVVVVVLVVMLLVGDLGCVCRRGSCVVLGNLEYTKYAITMIILKRKNKCPINHPTNDQMDNIIILKFCYP